MPSMYNIYCDESCHLEHDGINTMALGAVWCPKEKEIEIGKRLIEIKHKHGLSHKNEIKWNKISKSHFQPYLDLIDYFFDDDDLHFRGVVIQAKELLRHEKYGQTHDEWYYKMLFVLLRAILEPHQKYDIYLDYKDTKGAERTKKLREVLCNNYYDFDRNMISQIQLVKSHQVELIQLTDILIGSLTYIHRHLETNQGKIQIIERIKTRSKYSLLHSTLLRENKFNLLVWLPVTGENE